MSAVQGSHRGRVAERVVLLRLPAGQVEQGAPPRLLQESPEAAAAAAAFEAAGDLHSDLARLKPIHTSKAASIAGESLCSHAVAECFTGVCLGGVVPLSLLGRTHMAWHDLAWQLAKSAPRLTRYVRPEQLYRVCPLLRLQPFPDSERQQREGAQQAAPAQAAAEPHGMASDGPGPAVSDGTVGGEAGASGPGSGCEASPSAPYRAK